MLRALDAQPCHHDLIRYIYVSDIHVSVRLKLNSPGRIRTAVAGSKGPQD